jgi:hypothetical protein
MKNRMRTRTSVAIYSPSKMRGLVDLLVQLV